MLSKLSALILLSAAGCATVAAQQTPLPAEKNVQRMVFTTLFEGSYLGVQTQEITKENFNKFGLSSVQGVGIEKVVENSPAANAGLQNGDVIVRFEGEEITSVRKLNRLISEVAPDHKAKLTIVRGGSEREITVTLGKRELPQFQMGNFPMGDLQTLRTLPSMPAMPAIPRTMQTIPLPPMGTGGGNGDVFVFRGEASRQIGVGVVPLNKQLGDYFGISEGTGLLINNVRENSPADKAGLKAGDVIVEADGKAVKGMIDLIRVLNDKKEGDVSLTIVRDKNRQTIRVTPEISKDGATTFERYFENTPNQFNFQVQPPKQPTTPIAPTTQNLFAPRVL
jgi:serine protease Do